jgi:hypothetical protein
VFGVLFGLHGNLEVCKDTQLKLNPSEILALLLLDGAVLPLRFITICDNRDLGRSLTSYFLQFWN